MAASPSEVRASLNVVADQGVAEVTDLFGTLTGSGEQIRDGLLVVVPEVVNYYSDGSSALAADWYDDLRSDAAPSGRFTAEPVVNLQEEKLRRTVIWSVGPLFQPEPDRAGVLLRLLPEVQKAVASPFRDTVTTNSRRDPASNGWRRISSGSGCKFCRMLSDRGAVYRNEASARFAAHTSCHCSAQPVFQGQPGEEANVYQYVASQQRRTEKDRARLREYLNANY